MGHDPDGYWNRRQVGQYPLKLRKYVFGILGQYIYVDPEQDLIIVRFGKKSDFSYQYLFSRIGELIKEIS